MTFQVAEALERLETFLENNDNEAPESAFDAIMKSALTASQVAWMLTFSEQR